jgi:TonB-dependent receptor
VTHKNFIRTQLATSLSLILGTAALPALAQDAADANADLEVIQVKGIRGSLIQSMDVKRESVGIVDAITAEDIGKFPDSNLAESLQRITGVSIDRRNGEGFQVTVRGFGPEFNQITLNGRTMPAAQVNEAGGLNSSRSFDMSNIASEGVSGVTVYKSGQANITSGGIGATVDLQTRKPFQNEGFNASIGAKAVHDTTNRVGSEITPEISGFVSWSDDMFGVSVSASHQRRDNGRTGAFTNGWNDTSGGYTGSGFIPNGTTDDVVISNAPAIGTQTNFTPGLRYNHFDFERERQNAQITLQFRPNDRMEATLDYTYALQDIKSNRNELSLWFGGGAFPTSAIEFEESNGVATPLYWLTENDPSYDPRDVNFGVQGGHVENKLESLGFNFAYEVSDELTVKFDVHNSTAKALPGGDGPGNFWNVGIGGQGTSVQGIDNSGALPLLVGIWDERDGITGNTAGEIDKGDLSSTVRQIWFDRTESDLTQMRVDFEYQLSDEVAIDFGIESRDMEYTNRSSFDQTTLEGNWGASNPGDIPEDMVDVLNFASLFDGYSSEMSSGAQSFFNGAYGGEADGQLVTLGPTSFIGNANRLGDLLSNNIGLDWTPNPVDGTNRKIEEEITSLYTQLSLSGESGDITYDVLAGVRYEKTDITSTAQVAQPEILWQGDNDFLVQGGDAANAPLVVKDAGYDHILPSISVKLGLTDDIVAKMSWSKTIARADYSVLQHGVRGVGGPIGGPTLLGGNNGTATNGNVGLMPIESNNLDFSLEWYYDEGSYMSVGFFDKRVPNFIGNQEVVTTADTTRDPSNGPRAAAALAELNARGLDVNQQNLFRMVASLDDGSGGCVANANVAVNLCGADFDAAPYEGADGWENGVDIIALASDPLSVLDASTPVNANDARISGWELAAQHFFDDTGFGIQANITLVSGSVSYDVADTSGAAQFALTGLSDSANLVFIYENDDIQARLTYNWRDEFLNSANVGGNEPEFTEAYQQVDFSVGYNITEDWSVSFEGINILEEDIRRFGRSKRQFRSLEIYGARYALSTRYVF